jgi:hypothetical protein
MEIWMVEVVRLVVCLLVGWQLGWYGGSYEEEPLGQEAVEGQEVGCEGVHFGRLFGLYALLSSGCL